MSIKTLLSAIALLVTTLQVAKAQSSTAKADTSTIVGQWAGTYAGDSSGKFELVVNQGSSQKLTGRVTLQAENGNQQVVDLKTITWQNGQLKAMYTDPSEDDEVSFMGAYADSSLKGTWKSDGGQATGTWQLTRSTR